MNYLCAQPHRGIWEPLCFVEEARHTKEIQATWPHWVKCRLISSGKKQSSVGLGQRWREGWTAKKHEKFLAEVMEMSCILVAVLQELTTVKTHWAVYLKWIQFIIQKLFFNEVDKKIKGLTGPGRGRWPFSSVSYPKNNSSQTFVQSTSRHLQCQLRSMLIFSCLPFPFLQPSFLLLKPRKPLTASHASTNSTHPSH